MCLVERGRIGDPLAALFSGEGIDKEMGRTDESLGHRGHCLDGQQFLHQSRVNTAPELCQHFGQHKVGLGRVGLHLCNATGVHDGKVGPQTVANLFVGSAQLMFE